MASGWPRRPLWSGGAGSVPASLSLPGADGRPTGAFREARQPGRVRGCAEGYAVARCLRRPPPAGDETLLPVDACTGLAEALGSPGAFTHWVPEGGAGSPGADGRSGAVGSEGAEPGAAHRVTPLLEFVSKPPPPGVDSPPLPEACTGLVDPADGSVLTHWSPEGSRPEGSPGGEGRDGAVPALHTALRRSRTSANDPRRQAMSRSRPRRLGRGSTRRPARQACPHTPCWRSSPRPRAPNCSSVRPGYLRPRCRSPDHEGGAGQGGCCPAKQDNTGSWHRFLRDGEAGSTDDVHVARGRSGATELARPPEFFLARAPTPPGGALCDSRRPSSGPAPGGSGLPRARRPSRRATRRAG